MKICQIVSHIDEEASGPSYSVPMLCKSLSKKDNDVSLITLASRKIISDKIYHKHIEFSQSRLLSKLGISQQMNNWLKLNTKNFNLVHVHGLWMMPNIYPSRYTDKFKVPSILSPRGTMNKNALVYSKNKKKIMWMLLQKKALLKVDAFHATSEQEYEDIRSLGFKAPVAIIPNGVDLHNDKNIKSNNNIKNNNVRKLLYIGRIHPKKGLDMAIDAWSSLEKDFPCWKFKIVGKGEKNYIQSLNHKIKSYKLKNISISGPLYGEEKYKEFRNSDLFILPTRSENFGMVVAEALSFKLPVITTIGAPWEGLKKNSAGWSAEINAQSIGNVLFQALSMNSDQLTAMGENGFNWVRKDYSWNAVGEKMNQFYTWQVQKKNKPEFVFYD